LHSSLKCLGEENFSVDNLLFPFSGTFWLSLIGNFQLNCGANNFGEIFANKFSSLMILKVIIFKILTSVRFLFSVNLQHKLHFAWGISCRKLFQLHRYHWHLAFWRSETCSKLLRRKRIRGKQSQHESLSKCFN